MHSKAALVNEKQYQAKLLLQMATALDISVATDAAKIKALQAAAVLLLKTAVQLFIDEVALSCQIQTSPSSVKALSKALAVEQRSHAVVETLLQLELDQYSWLVQLQAWHDKVLQGQPLFINSMATESLIVMRNVDDDSDIESCLLAFTNFVLAQRVFLDEW